MIEIKCPANFLSPHKAVFLAGGITNCPDWRRTFINLFVGKDIVFLNPRRDAPIVPDALEQIRWEYNYINSAGLVVFWFPSETLCPITLFELGAQAYSHRNIVVGVHPDYARKLDVEIQLSLVAPFVKIVYTLEELAQQTFVKVPTRQ